MDYSCSRHQRQRVQAGWIPPNDRHNTWTHADPNNRHQQHTSFPLCLVRFRKGPGRFQVDNGSENRSGPEPSTPTEKPDSPRNAGCQHNFQSFVSGSFMQWPCLNAGVFQAFVWNFAMYNFITATLCVQVVSGKSQVPNQHDDPFYQKNSMKKIDLPNYEYSCPNSQYTCQIENII